mgnify:CR=1 FL=1
MGIRSVSHQQTLGDTVPFQSRLHIGCTCILVSWYQLNVVFFLWFRRVIPPGSAPTIRALPGWIKHERSYTLLAIDEVRPSTPTLQLPLWPHCMFQSQSTAESRWCGIPDNRGGISCSLLPSWFGTSGRGWRTSPIRKCQPGYPAESCALSLQALPQLRSGQSCNLPRSSDRSLVVYFGMSRKTIADMVR